MEKTRRILGLLSLVFGVSTWYLLWELTKGHESSYETGRELVTVFLLYSWFTLSLLNKVGMILNQNKIGINMLATIVFIVMLLMIWSGPPPDKLPELSYASSLASVVVWGWAIVDLIDSAVFD